MKRILLLFFTLCYSFFSQAQNVNGLLFDATNTGTRDGSAAFEINANTGGGLKGGFLMPRVALTGSTDATTIAGTEATGLIVFNDGTGGLTPAGFYYWTGSAWMQLATASGGTGYIQNQSAAVQNPGTFWIQGVGRVGDGTAALPGLSFNSGSNTGLYYVTGNMGLSTAGAERMRVASTGQVSINTTATPGTLNVNGTAVIGAGLTSRSALGTTISASDAYAYTANTDVGDGHRMFSVVNENATAGNMAMLSMRVNPGGGANNQMLDLKLVNPNDGTSKFIYSFGPGGSYTNGDRFTFTSAGNLGIGTTSPGGKLQIGPLDDNHIILTSNNNTYGWRIDTKDNLGGSVPLRIFKRTASTDTEVLTILNQNGNVGIGSNLPNQKLEVAGNTRITGLAGSGTKLVQTNNSGDLAVSSLDPSTVMTTSNISGTTNYVSKFTGTNTIGNSQIFDDATNVGISSATPNQKLIIGGNGGIGFFGSSPGLNSADKKIYSPADGDLEWMTHTAAGVHGFAVSHQGTKLVYLNIAGDSYFNGGNLGVGMTVPGHRLGVQRAAGASSTSDVWLTDGTQWEQLNTNSSGGAWSPMVSAGDHTIIYSNGSAETGGLVIGQWSASGKGIKIDAAGNIGIGVASPSFHLDVKPGTSNAIARVGSWAFVENVVSNQTLFSRNAYYDGTWKYANTGYATAIRMNDDAGTGDIRFHLSPSGTAGNTITNMDGSDIKMVLTNAGNLGIGTTVPSSFKVQVAGDLGPNADLTYNLGSPSLRWNNLYVNSISGPGALWTRSSPYLYNTTLTDNVGIGIATPVARLHVSGTHRQTGDMEIDGGNTLYFGREESFGGADIGGADYGFIRWDNDNNTYNKWGDSGENGALVIGSQNDGANSVSDVVVLNGVAANIFDATSGINYFTGNIGIGTFSPVAKLHISGGPPTSVGALPANTMQIVENGTSNNYITFRNSADNGTYQGIQFQDNNVGGYIAFRNYVGSGANDGTNGDYMVYGTYTDHIFQTGAAEPVNTKTEVMRIKQGGNVGIGTSNPGDDLHVKRSTYRITAENSADGDGLGSVWGTFSSIGQGRNPGFSWAGGTLGLTNNMNSDFSFFGLTGTNDDSQAIINWGDDNDLMFAFNGTERMRLTGTGSLGIGISSPNARLDVSTGADGIAMGQIHGDNTNTIQTYIDGQWSNRASYAGGCCNPLLLQPDVGTVGVGTTSPAARFHVWGNTTTAAIISAGGSYYTDWPGGWGGGLSSWDLCIASMKYTGLTARSDIRLKKEITELNSINALELIKQMRPVSYRWIDERLPQHLNYGLIAQEVEQLLPDLVDTGVDSMQTKGLHYMDLIPILIQGMKEQQKEIEALKAGNATSAENLQMKNEIAELKKMMLELKEKKINK